MFRRSYAPGEARDDAVYTARTPISMVILRTILTAIGAAAVGIGAFLQWYKPSALAGTSTDWRVFYRPSALQNTVDIFRSAGGIMVLIAIFALLGLVFRSGLITRFAGVLALIGFGLFVATVYRAHGNASNGVGPGMWIILGGSIVTVIGGFMTGYHAVAQRTTTTGAAVAGAGAGAAAATAGSRTDMLSTEHECHVMRNSNGGWDVVGPGRNRDVASYGSQREAEMRARELLAVDGGGLLVVHRRNGKIRARQTVAAA